MKILYGINATGNGHLSRARVIVSKLKERGHIVECILSGRNDDKLFDLNASLYLAGIDILPFASKDTVLNPNIYKI